MKKQLFFFVLALCLGVSLRAQNLVPASDSAAPASASEPAAILIPTPDPYEAQLVRDSLIRDLSEQVQDMRMQNFMLQEALERTGRQIALDSAAQADRRRMVDSLKAVTPGAPLVVDEDTLLRLFVRRGGITPEARVAAAAGKIEDLGRRLTFQPDSLYVFEGDFTSDIMAGSEVLLSITDMDALWESRPRAELAGEYARLIQAKIDAMQDEYGLRTKLLGLSLAVAILLTLFVSLRLTLRFFARRKRRFLQWIMPRIKPLVLKDYEFLNVHRQGLILMTLYRALLWLCLLIQLMVAIPLIFSIFPETEMITFTVLGYLWNPFKGIVLSVVGYIPNLFQIFVIWLCFHYLMRLLRYFTREIESERLKIDGFYADWAQPTYLILRVLLYSLMLVMIWPLLPSSNSQIFQGVSVFIGLILSLGSTSIVGNVIAGLVMTYMRPFRLGDYIQVGDTVGEVIEKSILVTRIRTRKNEVVTIQNSSLMGSQTSNFSLSARNYGVIVHTKVTIGYDVPWQKIKEIMETAALATPGIRHTPRPFMQITALNDFYVEYEINAYTTDAEHLPAVYSDLHANILRRFFEEGVEIMSPHIFAHRQDLDVQMPDEYKK